MDRSPITRAGAVAALRASLFESGSVAEGFAPIELADPGGDELRLRFRWHSDRRTYVRLLPVGPNASVTGGSTGARVPAESWADAVRLRLVEELSTGFVRRAARRREADGIVLLEPVDGRDHRRDVYYTRDVPLLRRARTWPSGSGWRSAPRRGSQAEDPDVRIWELDPLAGSWLADGGLDVRIPRRLIAEGRLLAWKQLCEDTLMAPLAGHAASGWDPDRTGVARLEVVGTLEGVHDEAAQQLIASVCHDAAGSGATEIVTDLTGPAIDAAGFVAEAGGISRRIGLRAGQA